MKDLDRVAPVVQSLHQFSHEMLNAAWAFRRIWCQDIHAARHSVFSKTTKEWTSSTIFQPSIFFCLNNELITRTGPSEVAVHPREKRGHRETQRYPEVR